MNGQMDWGELFFSAAGRAPRGPSLMAGGLLLLIAALYEAVSSGRPTLHWITGLFVYVPLFFSGCCVLSKRLHDRGRSGWWAALILVAIVAVWPRPDTFFDFLFALVLIWAAIELGVMPGEAGANRYGPNPLRPVASA